LILLKIKISKFWFNFKKFNQDYKDNLLKLKNLVLVKFNLDTMVVPRESEV
jgi:hypothetical protein